MELFEQYLGQLSRQRQLLPRAHLGGLQGPIVLCTCPKVILSDELSTYFAQRRRHSILSARSSRRRIGVLSYSRVPAPSGRPISARRGRLAYRAQLGDVKYSTVQNWYAETTGDWRISTSYERAMRSQ